MRERAENITRCRGVGANERNLEFRVALVKREQVALILEQHLQKR